MRIYVKTMTGLIITINDVKGNTLVGREVPEGAQKYQRVLPEPEVDDEVKKISVDDILGGATGNLAKAGGAAIAHYWATDEGVELRSFLGESHG